MKPSEKQIAVLRFLMSVDSATKREIMDVLSVDNQYYINADKHFGELLSRMVKSKFIIRIKKGNYKFLSTESNKAIVDPDQISIF